MKKSLRIIAAVFAAAALTASLSSCNKKTKEVKTTVIGYRTGSLCAIPMHIAVLNGLFEKEFSDIGQKVELLHQTGASGTTATLVGSGKVDAGFELISSMLQTVENGLPIVFATGVHTGCTKYYAKADSGINTVGDLRGKKAGVVNLTDSSVMYLRRKLADYGIKSGLTDSEVEFFVYEMSVLGEALNRGDVDFIALHEPMATLTENEYGLKLILDTATDEKFKDEYCCQIFVTEDFLNDNPEGVKAFVRAIQKASAFVQAVPEEAVKIQLDNNFASGSVEFNAAILKQLDYTPSYEKGRKTFENAVRELKAIGVLKESTDAEALINRGYIKIEGIPEGYTYDPETKTYTELK